MAQITLTDIHVDGVNTLVRAEGIKKFILGYGARGKDAYVPILRGLNFSARTGERIGIIGSNGSGKSSLLKVIAGIYPPKAGTVEVAGKVAPLIEMGVGFDYEMSGRENIRVGLLYSNRLLDYSQELAARIIEFTGLADHMDKPLKTFSSGMQARLSFAISLFQEPDILLLDEAFAPGDIAFIQKAQDAMAQKFNSVPIAILVTHSSELVTRFCNRCVWMKDGQVEMDGAPALVTAAYAQHFNAVNVERKAL